MQPRERNLAIGLAVVLVVGLGLQFVKPLFTGPVEERRRQLTAARNAFDKADVAEMQTLAAVSRLTKWKEEAALPGPPLSALRTYHEWLIDLAIASGWTDIDLSPVRTSRPIAAGVTPVEVRGQAKATAAALSDFLAAYEAAPLMHRLARLAIETESDDPGSVLTIDLQSVAVVIDKAADRDWTPSEDIRPLAARDVAWQRLADGSPFTRPAPPAADPGNQPPQFRTPRDRTVATGERASTFLEASDPDGDDAAIRFELVRRIDGVTLEDDRLEYVPPTSADGQKTAIEVAAIDADGGRSVLTWTIDVAPNDAATTELVGSMMLDEQPVAWLVNRADGRRVEVRAGDRIAIGRVEGEIESIGRKTLTFARDGQRYELKLGDPLTRARPL